MSDKPTVEELYDELCSDCENTIYAKIQRVAKAHPEWFAPGPDPVERYTNLVCERCEYMGSCPSNAAYSESVKQCRANRDALRAYVAELKRKAGGK